jgi:SAM-dependent methyltransferase
MVRRKPTREPAGDNLAESYARLTSRAQTPAQLQEKVNELVAGIQSHERADLAVKLLDHHVWLLSKDFVPLLSGDPINFPNDRLENIVALFYGAIDDAYIGVDSHVPSRFRDVHPFLLDHLSDRLETQRRASPVPNPINVTHCYGNHIVRIIPRTMRELRTDYKRNRAAFDEYIQWHQRNGAHLLRVDPKVATEASRARHLWSTDVGVWLTYCALLFQPELQAGNFMRLELVSADDEDQFRRCVDYLLDLLASTKELVVTRNTVVERDLDPRLAEHLTWSLEGLFEHDLARRWIDFVSPDERLSKGEGEFLTRLLQAHEKDPPNIRVFDAAMGVGAESVFLAEAGCNVVSNEIDRLLIDHARKYAESRPKPVPLRITNYDWRHLGSEMDDPGFDMVLVLGNSLTCLENPDQMLDCLKGFRDVLDENGTLVIDERNYAYMFHHRERLLRQSFRFAGKVVYCGDIKAKPEEIPAEPGQVITLGYYENGKRVGTFRVYAFAEGQVASLLDQAGFEVTKRYFDFQEREKPDAEFITYIARPKR